MRSNTWCGECKNYTGTNKHHIHWITALRATCCFVRVNGQRSKYASIKSPQMVLSPKLMKQKKKTYLKKYWHKNGIFDPMSWSIFASQKNLRWLASILFRTLARFHEKKNSIYCTIFVSYFALLILMIPHAISCCRLCFIIKPCYSSEFTFLSVVHTVVNDK